MSFFHHRCLYPFIDYVLTSKEKQNGLDEMLQDKCIFYTDPSSKVVEKLSTAQILYIHPDSFDQWTDILLFIQDKRALPVKLMIFADSDLSLELDHMEPLFAFFPQTQFWIQNWMGAHPQATLLPLGMSNIIVTPPNKKKSLLGISYLILYIGCKPRDEFFAFLRAYPEMLAYCFPKLRFNDYCKILASCSFHTCPMGEGFDTFRFWESLALGTTPIVIDHPFYEYLQKEYPSVPMLRLSSWEELPSRITTLQPHTHVCMDFLYENYWVDKIKKLSVKE